MKWAQEDEVEENVEPEIPAEERERLPESSPDGQGFAAPLSFPGRSSSNTHGESPAVTRRPPSYRREYGVNTLFLSGISSFLSPAREEPGDERLLTGRSFHPEECLRGSDRAAGRGAQGDRVLARIRSAGNPELELVPSASR